MLSVENKHFMQSIIRLNVVTQHNDTQHNGAGVCCYAERHLRWMSFMLSVANKQFMHSVIIVIIDTQR